MKYDGLDIVAMILAFLITLQFLSSLYWGMRMIISKSENRYGWCPEMLRTVEAFLWVILFGYIFIKIFLNENPIANDSFGAMYVRPVILISSTITSILQRRRYLKYIKKIKEQREAKGG